MPIGRDADGEQQEHDDDDEQPVQLGLLRLLELGAVLGLQLRIGRDGLLDRGARVFRADAIGAL